MQTDSTTALATTAAAYDPKSPGRRRRYRPALMLAALKAWSVQEKNGLKDFALVRPSPLV
jgi:hypothetical protein